jgi:hypothetical protein
VSGPVSREAWERDLAQAQLARVNAEIQKMAAEVAKIASDTADGDVTARAAAIARAIHWGVWNARLDDMQVAVARAAYYQGQADAAVPPTEEVHP